MKVNDLPFIVWCNVYNELRKKIDDEFQIGILMFGKLSGISKYIDIDNI